MSWLRPSSEKYYLNRGILILANLPVRSTSIPPLQSYFFLNNRPQTQGHFQNGWKTSFSQLFTSKIIDSRIIFHDIKGTETQRFKKEPFIF